MSENSNAEIIKTSNNNKYILFKLENKYYIADTTEEKPRPVTTPGGEILCTRYASLADRLFEDIQCFGTQCMDAKSILPWHYTMCERFSQIDHKELEDLLDTCFMQKPDWTYDCCDNDDWTNIFGNQAERVSEIREWLSKCTHMQMTAACCIGNAYHSINIAFVLASIMENYTGKDRKKQFKLLADLIAENSFYGPTSDMIKDFNNFDLYYGIHLDEEGSIINNESFGIYGEADEDGFAITEEMLIGRNYYHYTGGEKDDEQPFSLNHDLTSYLSEEDNEDDEDDEDEDDFVDDEDEADNELAEYLPDDCWVKKISAVDDDGEAYYIIAVEVNDGKATGITVLLDEVSRMGGGMFFIPGMAMPGNHSYEEIDVDDYEAVENEIEALKKGRFISKDFSFVGKKLPEEMIENDKYNGDDTQYMICLQSAHRLAYVDLFINTDEDGIVEDFEYSTYQSTGSGYGDMFSRPQGLDDKNEEAIDMLLYIIDKYSDDEYQRVVESLSDCSDNDENNNKNDNELSAEEDYWFIDANEKAPEKMNVSDFFSLCIRRFTEVAQNEGIVLDPISSEDDLLQYGEKIVSSFLTDRYIVHRKETQPDIYYNFEVQLAIESGIVLSPKRFDTPLLIDNIVEKIIKETPYDEISKMLEKSTVWKDQCDLKLFCDEVWQTWYEELKWYYQNKDFDNYLKKSLLAAFWLGISIVPKKTNE